MSLKDHVILVVEDEKPLQDAIVAKFKVRDCQTVSARSVEQALGYLSDVKNINVIWLDHYLLGKEDGLDFVEKVKANEKWKSIPIYVVSNTATADKVKTYLKFGVEKYYVKSDNKIDKIVQEVINQIEEND